MKKKDLLDEIKNGEETIDKMKKTIEKCEYVIEVQTMVGEMFKQELKEL
jgi:hypothetical protein